MLETLLLENKSRLPPFSPGKWTELETMASTSGTDGILVNINGYIHTVSLRQPSASRGTCSYYDHTTNKWLYGGTVTNNGYNRTGVKVIGADISGIRTGVFVGGTNLNGNGPLAATGYFTGDKGTLGIVNLSSTGFPANFGPNLSPNSRFASGSVEIFGGSNASGNVYDRYSLNLINNSMTKLTNLAPMTNRNNYGFYRYLGSDYIVMGNLTASTYSKEITKRNTSEAVNVNTDINSPVGRGSFSMIGLGKYIYILGGRTNGNVFLKEFIRFNIETSEWNMLDYVDDGIAAVTQQAPMTEKDGNIYLLLGTRFFRYTPPEE